MAATLKSFMILNNATADIPAAGTTGAHDFDTTLLTPTYDNGSAKVPWRFTTSTPVIAPTGTAVTIVTGAAYADIFGGSGQMLLDFTRFRQARITTWVAIQVGSTSATVKAYDVTNSQDMTGTITVNSTTASRKTSAWTTLNSATYAGDASFDIRALEGVGADVLKFFSLRLELR